MSSRKPVGGATTPNRWVPSHLVSAGRRGSDQSVDMRTANVVVSVLGISGVAVAAAFAWRWRRIPLLAATRPVVDTSGRAALDGLRTLAVATTAGVVAGVLVPGLGGRLVMRILAATSGDGAQGQLTEANEVVGKITTGGTISIVIFVGLLGGLLAAAAFVLVRRWLPATAAPAGLVAGILLLGTIGVSDAMSPDNVDFAILRPTWLAVTLIVVVALLFGVTFTALAARLDSGIATLDRRPSSIAGHASLVVLLFPPLVVGAAAYVAGRAALRGRLAPLLDSSTGRRVGRIVVGVAVVLAAVSSVGAIVEIVSA